MNRVFLAAPLSCLLTLLLSLPVVSEAQHAEPSLTVLRYDEDDSYLRNRGPSKEFKRKATSNELYKCRYRKPTGPKSGVNDGRTA